MNRLVPPPADQDDMLRASRLLNTLELGMKSGLDQVQANLRSRVLSLIEKGLRAEREEARP